MNELFSKTIMQTNINILFASGCKTHNYKNILKYINSKLTPFYELNLVKCFWILSNNNNPCNMVQRKQYDKNKLIEIIENKLFSEYELYNL